MLLCRAPLPPATPQPVSLRSASGPAVFADKAVTPRSSQPAEPVRGMRIKGDAARPRTSHTFRRQPLAAPCGLDPTCRTRCYVTHRQAVPQTPIFSCRNSNPCLARVTDALRTYAGACVRFQRPRTYRRLGHRIPGPAAFGVRLAASLTCVQVNARISPLAHGGGATAWRWCW